MVIFYFQWISGAPERRNLEPELADQLLSELEDWAEVLKGEPEVIHRLDEIAARERAGEEEDEPSAVSVNFDLPEPGL